MFKKFNKCASGMAIFAFVLGSEASVAEQVISSEIQLNKIYLVTYI